MKSLILIVFGLVKFSLEMELNLTKLDNCPEVLSSDEEWPIQIEEMHYGYNEKGFIDHMYGTYIVRTIDTRDKELTITVYKCSSDDPSPCERKVEHIISDLHCEKFLNDNSGIWHMISQAMTGSACGGETGIFVFDIPQIKRQYFEKYLVEDEHSSRFRMHLLFHKKNDESKNRRACLEILFDAIAIH